MVVSPSLREAVTRWFAIAACIVLMLPTYARGQAPSAFEVASVKANASGSPISRLQEQPNGRLTATNVPLRELVRYAFGLPSTHAIEGPSLLERRFDVEATPPGGGAALGRDAVRAMLRVLLADRFKLRSRTETRQIPVYVLSIARADGQLGPGLTRVSTDCAAMRTALRDKAPVADIYARPVCSYRTKYGSTREVEGLSFDSLPLSQFLTFLTFRLRLPVIDRTGLTGLFSFELVYSSSDPLLSPGGVGQASIPDGRPLLLDAIADQLGLRLKSGTGPGEVLIVDHVEPPTPN